MAAQLPDQGIIPGGQRRASLDRPIPEGSNSVANSTPVASSKLRQNWPLYLFVFLLPLQNIQTGYFPILPGGINFLNIGFIASLVGALYCRGKITRWSGVHKWVWMYVLWGAITLWIGVVVSPDASAKRFSDFKDSQLAVLLLFVVEMSVTDWSTLKRVLLATILPLPYIFRVTWAEHRSVSGWHFAWDMKVNGTFSMLGANEFSSFCVTMALMLFALLLAAKLSKIWRILVLGGIVCMVAGILWTYSRTSYVTILVGAALIVLVWRGRWKMAIPVVIAIAVVPPLLPYSVTQRFDDTHVSGRQVDTSTDMRYVYWGIALKEWKSHPIAGIGNYTFSYVNPFKMDTHNVWIRTLAEKGLIGLIILAGLFLSFMRAAWRTLRHSPPGSGNIAYALGLGMIGAVPALAIGNFWGDRLTYAPMIGYFWILLALMLKAHELSLADAKASTPPVAAATAKPRFALPRHGRRA